MAGEVEIRTDRFQAFVAGHSLDLTRREFELIELLAAAEGRVLEREEIYSRLWGYAMVRGDRSVDVFVRKLRQKLERASPRWRYIHTHFGIGYRFAAESLDAIAAGAASSVHDGDVEASVAPGATADAGSVPVEWDAGDQRELPGTHQERELHPPSPSPLAARPPGRPSSDRSARRSGPPTVSDRSGS